jgi:transcriptional regulator with XRE-family HTH domain
VSAASASTTKSQWLQSIGENVRRQRRSAGLTQEKLAEMADLAPRTIQKIEAGQLDILATTIKRLQKALRCRYDDLLG